MALIICHECKKEVSTDATNCPHCGAKVKKPTSILTMGCAVVFIGFFGLTMCGLLLGDKPARNGGGASTPQPDAASEPAIQLNVREITAAYKGNEIAADQQFKGKVIEVTGTVGDIKKDIMDSIYVTVGTGQAFEFPVVQAFFDDEWAAQAATLKKGQKITIRGRVDGLMMNVLVRDSSIVQ